MRTVDINVQLTALGSEDKSRPVGDWLTTFPLVPVVLDPYTAESARILRTAHRIMANYQGADCRPCWLLTCDADGARRFLGPWAEDMLTFVDPARSAVAAFRLSYLPAFMLMRQDGSIIAEAQGWDPLQWRTVAKAVSALTKWNRPVIGDADDPPPYPGTPAQP